MNGDRQAVLPMDTRGRTQQLGVQLRQFSTAHPKLDESRPHARAINSISPF
jgi:hypothetical protein